MYNISDVTEESTAFVIHATGSSNDSLEKRHPESENTFM